jgi:hypothetical protein
MYTNIANIPTNAAIKAEFKALSHSVGLIFSSCIRTNGAGNAPLFRESTNSFAPSIVKSPSICAVPPQILDWITGDVSIFHHTNIAI